MSTTKKDNSNLKSCPFTVTVRRNPPRRARATPSHGIAPFPNEEILSEQVSHIPSATSEDEILKNPSSSENENPINPTASENENLINPTTSEENENLKVFLRIRPSQPPNQAQRVRAKTAWPKKQTKNVTNNLKKKSSSSCISMNDSQSVTLLVPSDLQDAKRVKSETYGGFSHVFPSDSSQLEVYERMVKPMVDEFMKGKSGMLAALGPSGSGKTHTVFGTPRDPGMVPLVLRHIFKETEASRSYYVAIFEIYTERGKSEKLFDLLPDGSELSMQQSTIKGQKEVLISNAEQAESLIAQAVIKRATAMTNTNCQSSRSQCIINIRDVPKKGKGVVNSKSSNAVLTIIDLAGAEREKRTGNQGTRLVESNFINNTLMVFGLCLRSLLEHQKNPKKQLQKHFQNSMLTRYLRDYLEGKKRMTLLLTAKSGEDDYLDTSHLLRQASPYMQIKYNEVEPSINMVPKKRHHQASSIIDCAKQSPSLAHLKRMKLVGEHAVQNAEKSVEECDTSKKDTSTVSKFDDSSSVPLKSECNSHAESERSQIIMRNFARVLWNVLKESNSKLKAAESEILGLKEIIGYEKEKNLELETQLNAFRAACTCCGGGNGKTNIEDCSLVDLDHRHNLDQEEFNAESSSFEPRLDQSDAEHMPCSTCSELDYEKSDRKLSISLSKSGHHNALEVDAMDKMPCEIFHSESSLEPSNEEHMLGSTCRALEPEKSDGEVPGSLSNSGIHKAFEVNAVRTVPNETFNAESPYKPIIDQLAEEHMLGSTCMKLDSEISDREVSVSSSKPGHDNSLEVDAETFNAESPSKPIIDQLGEEHMLGSTCLKSDSEISDREVSVSSSKPVLDNSLEVDVGIDRLGEEQMLGSNCTKLDSEISDREVSVSSSKPVHDNSLEVDAGIDQLGEEQMLGSNCTELDYEISDREVSVSSSKPVHDNSLEVDTETFQPQTSSEPMTGPGRQLDSEKSNSLVLGVLASSSKPGDHKDSVIEAKSKILSELLDSSLSTKDGILDPSLPKNVLSTETQKDKGVSNSSLKPPPRSKRTLMPSSSMLSRNLSTFDLFDESEKLKENRGTRKLGARDDPKRSNGSISLLHMLHGRKGNIRH
ncbi:kinesin-like protein KIN-6 isoform X1 [Lathyrus oleraceus]|nr:kinesin-like protein KIN-6 isoform X1 [Pisum sativum]